MAIKDFFKASPDPDRERCLRDPDQILAWLEELCRIRTVVDLSFGHAEQMPIPSKVELVGEETRSVTLSLQRAPFVEPVPGQKAQAVFPLDGRRFQAELAYQGRGGYREYRFKLPAAIRHAERRDTVRVHFRSREKLSVVVLQGLLEGLGLTGELVDLSLGGCGFLVHRAIRIQDERRMPVRADLLVPGAPLALVRLTNLPHLPMVECAGRVSHLHQWPGGVTMGLAFESLGAFESGILAKFMAERIPGFRADFPWKRRYRDLTEAERLGPQPPSEPEELELPEPPSEAAQAFSDLEIAELRDTIRDSNRLNQLRKRGKKVLLVMADELDRTLLLAAFHQDGYRCLFEAPSLVQALEQHRRYALDLVVVDQAVGRHGALEVVEALRAHGLPREVPSVVLLRKPDVRLTVAARAGGVDLLVAHPVDFPAVLRNPLEALLGLG